MATLTMQPIGPSPGPATQEDQRSGKSSSGDDLGDIDSGTRTSFRRIWPLLPPALLQRSLTGRGGFLEAWCSQLCHSTRESGMQKTVGMVENAVEVVEHVAEVTEKLAANVAVQLPEDGSVKKVAEKVEYIAGVVDNDAEKVEAIAEKIDTVSDEIDAAVEPIIDELEKELDQSPTPNNGANAHN